MLVVLQLMCLKVLIGALMLLVRLVLVVVIEQMMRGDCGGRNR